MVFSRKGARLSDHGGAWLRLDHGMVGGVVPACASPVLASVLSCDDSDAPALVVMDESPSWTFLADAYGFVLPDDELPDDVTMVRYSARVPIPAADACPVQARWAVLPDLHRRWLPTLAAVLCAIRRVARMSLWQASSLNGPSAGTEGA